MKRIFTVIGVGTVACVVLAMGVALFSRNSASTATKGRVTVTLMAPSTSRPATTVPTQIPLAQVAEKPQQNNVPSPTAMPENAVIGYKDGFYLVNKDIQPGRYRSTGEGSDCYWSRQDETQDTISNHYGMAGGVIVISPDDFQVEFENCGTFVSLEAIPIQPEDVQRAPRGDGFYLVGYDIAPGIWRSDSGGDSCYWKRSDKTLGVIDNDYGMAGGTVTIQPSDFQVEFDNCGTWTLIS